MRSAVLVDSRASRLQPMTCDMHVALVHPETTFVEAFVALAGEICRRDFTIIDCMFAPTRSYPDICRILEAKAKSATAWPNCISECNIRDP
jgi:hypothetical protein